MIYYTIYKVTNNVNGKIYIGSHKTKDLNDNYMGSGKYLNRAFQKYGLENFTKEILFIFDNPKDMYAKESEIVNEEFLAESNTYNLKKGGFGGFDYINSIGKNLYGLNGKTPNVKKNFEKAKRTKEEKKKIDPNYSLNISKKISNSLKGRSSPFKDKQHSDYTKKIIGSKSSEHQKGSGNSQYGKKWIYSLEEKKSIKINKNDLIPFGWLEGRKIKF
jgi:group I intron endonuclease